MPIACCRSSHCERLPLSSGSAGHTPVKRLKPNVNSLKACTRAATPSRDEFGHASTIAFLDKDNACIGKRKGRGQLHHRLWPQLCFQRAIVQRLSERRVTFRRAKRARHIPPLRSGPGPCRPACTPSERALARRTARCAAAGPPPRAPRAGRRRRDTAHARDRRPRRRRRARMSGSCNRVNG